VESDGIGTMSSPKNNGVDPAGSHREIRGGHRAAIMMFASPPEQTLEWRTAASKVDRAS